jgi:hypothetical protein
MLFRSAVQLFVEPSGKMTLIRLDFGVSKEGTTK